MAATAAVAAALLALLGSPNYWLLLALGFVVGGLASPLYPLSVAETNDWLEENELVPAGAGMVLAYSLGASVGPLTASLVMERIGYAGLFAFAAVALAVLALFALYRVVRGLAKPVEEQTDFWPASWVTPVAAEMDPRGPDEPDYDEGAEGYWDDEEAPKDEE